jgi:hypothetical protein
MIEIFNDTEKPLWVLAILKMSEWDLVRKLLEPQTGTKLNTSENITLNILGNNTLIIKDVEPTK